MNQGQKMFYDFFIERTRDDKKAEAKLLLENGFAKQADSTFDKAYLDEVTPKYFELIKSEAVDELKAAMANFAARL